MIPTSLLASSIAVLISITPVPPSAAVSVPATSASVAGGPAAATGAVAAPDPSPSDGPVQQPSESADTIAWVFSGIAVVVAGVIALGFFVVLRRGLKRDR